MDANEKGKRDRQKVGYDKDEKPSCCRFRTPSTFSIFEVDF